MREEHASCPVRADPFGHSNTEAWLLSAEAGMESLFWGRTDYQVGPAGAGAAELKGRGGGQPAPRAPVAAHGHPDHQHRHGWATPADGGAGGGPYTPPPLSPPHRTWTTGRATPGTRRTSGRSGCVLQIRSMRTYL
jgi:hypothetical protein